MEISVGLEFGAIFVSIFFFGLGSVSDLKKREVDDRVWMAYAGVGGALTVARLLIDSSMLLLVLGSIGVSVLFSFVLFYFGMFGGADAKAIMCLGLTLPLNPVSYEPMLGYVHPFFPVNVVLLGFVFSASVAVWYGIVNLFSYRKEGSSMFAGVQERNSWRRLLMMLTGYRTTLDKLQSTFYLYPLEEIVSDEAGTRRSIKLFFDAEADRDQMVSRFIESFRNAGFSGKVWVTPGLPMLVFILVGLLVALVVGDPIFSLVVTLAAR